MRNRSNRLLGALLLIALLSSAVVQAIDISQTLTEEKKEVATGTDVLYFIGGGERFILRNADLNTWTQEDAINALPASMIARVTKPFGLLHQGMMLQEGVPLGKQGIKSEVWLVLAPHIRFHDL